MCPEQREPSTPGTAGVVRPFRHVPGDVSRRFQRADLLAGVGAGLTATVRVQRVRPSRHVGQCRPVPGPLSASTGTERTVDRSVTPILVPSPCQVPAAA